MLFSLWITSDPSNAGPQFCNWVGEKDKAFVCDTQGYSLCSRINTHCFVLEVLVADQMPRSNMCMLKSCPTLCDPMDYPTRLLCPWDFPGKNTGVSCHFLFQSIFQPRDQTQYFFASCISRQILYLCATWEAHGLTRDVLVCLLLPKCY